MSRIISIVILFNLIFGNYVAYGQGYDVEALRIRVLEGDRISRDIENKNKEEGEPDNLEGRAARLAKARLAEIEVEENGEIFYQDPTGTEQFFEMAPVGALIDITVAGETRHYIKNEDGSVSELDNSGNIIEIYKNSKEVFWTWVGEPTIIAGISYGWYKIGKNLLSRYLLNRGLAPSADFFEVRVIEPTPKLLSAPKTVNATKVTPGARLSGLLSKLSLFTMLSVGFEDREDAELNLFYPIVYAPLDSYNSTMVALGKRLFFGASGQRLKEFLEENGFTNADRYILRADRTLESGDFRIKEPADFKKVGLEVAPVIKDNQVRFELRKKPDNNYFPY